MTIERFAVDPDKDRETWLALRSRDLTASGVPCVAGIDPYRTALSYYLEKAGLIPPVAENALMERGRLLEPAGLQAIRNRHPSWRVVPARVYLRDPELKLGATPDALAETDDPGLTNIQVKVVSKPVFERDWEDEPPVGYQVQTATENMLTGADRGLVAALIIDTYSIDLELFPVPRNERVEEMVRELARQFWRNMEAGLLPPADWKRDSETLAQLYPRAVDEPVLDLSGDNRMPARLAERAGLKALVKAAEERLKEIDTEIRSKMKEHGKATLPGWKISLANAHRDAHTVAAADWRQLRVTPLKDRAA